MSSSPFPNVYTHRKVADTASKGCNICYKPTTSVLITPEKQDFFYVCAIHLKDKNFATPIIDHAAIEARLKAEAEAKKKKELDEEVERVKKEYAEKQKAKAEKDDKGKDKDQKEQDKDKAQPDSKKEETPKPEDKAKEASPTAATAVSSADEEPRVFALASMRLSGQGFSPLLGMNWDESTWIRTRLPLDYGTCVHMDEIAGLPIRRLM
ncbi:hypothetical protein OOU_Y34scaffold01003g16 [Pyricularia oryzae Y34]|uniref:DUF1742-domain-containing protein n=2 Tax=Pyricularia oryzae TaxID=318829 RepID=A0AA97PFV6_PYRO3|nr:hypothetical protein OOU_Y34scaffold01003g16 [Pyricularia oryzae Y34]